MAKEKYDSGVNDKQNYKPRFGENICQNSFTRKMLKTL